MSEIEAEPHHVSMAKDYETSAKAAEAAKEFATANCLWRVSAAMWLDATEIPLAFYVKALRAYQNAITAAHKGRQRLVDEFSRLPVARSADAERQELRKEIRQIDRTIKDTLETLDKVRAVALHAAQETLARSGRPLPTIPDPVPTPSPEPTETE